MNPEAMLASRSRGVGIWKRYEKDFIVWVWCSRSEIDERWWSLSNTTEAFVILSSLEPAAAAFLYERKNIDGSGDGTNWMVQEDLFRIRLFFYDDLFQLLCTSGMLLKLPVHGIDIDKLVVVLYLAVRTVLVVRLTIFMERIYGKTKFKIPAHSKLPQLWVWFSECVYIYNNENLEGGPVSHGSHDNRSLFLAKGTFRKQTIMCDCCLQKENEAIQVITYRLQ